MPSNTKEYSRQHYEANKEAYKARARANNVKAIKRNKDFLREYLGAHPCVDCGEDDLLVLQFDHLSDKTRNVSQLVNSAHSLTRIQAEIDKCEVVCANCHVRRTAKRHGGWWRSDDGT